MVSFRTIIAAFVFFALSAQAAEYKAPRGPGGVHPDLNGIWQALNTANYDIEMHTASHSMQLREGPHGPLPTVKTMYLGAVASVPPGLGVVVDGKIPYTPEALAKKQENKANWIDRDPEVKCFLPGIPRATYMPQPFQIFQSADSVFMAYQYAGAVREVYMEDPGEAEHDDAEDDQEGQDLLDRVGQRLEGHDQGGRQLEQQAGSAAATNMWLQVGATFGLSHWSHGVD